MAETPRPQTEAAEALLRQFETSRPPEGLRDMTSHEVQSKIGQLFNGQAQLERYLATGQAFRMMNVTIPDEAVEDARQRVLPVVDGLLEEWVTALEALHGEVGGAYITELAIKYERPFRSRPPRTRGGGLPRDAEISAARGAAQQQAEQERRRALEAQAAARVSEIVSGDDNDYLTLEREGEIVVGARVRTDYDGPDPDDMLAALLDGEAGPSLRRLTLGLWTNDAENDYGDAIALIAERGPLPQIEELFIGDFEYPDETEISWTTVGDLSPLYAALPNLKRLRVRGGGIRLGTLAHPKLESLILETGGLEAGAVRSVTALQCPSLRHLEVWFGDGGYGAEGTAEMVAPLLTAAGAGPHRSSPRLANLEVLGLRNAEFTDELCPLLVRSALARRLKGLDLSLGTLTDKGAAILADGAAAFEMLEWLDIGECYVGEHGVAALKEALRNVRGVESQDVPDGDDDETWCYVSVGE